MVKVKICGLTTKDAIDALSLNKADFAGFVFFARSPRNVTPADAGALAKNLNRNIKKVAVLVDPDDAFIEKIITKLNPDYLQLHGDETPERIDEIQHLFSIPIIKAAKIRSSDDVARAGAFIDIADIMLFDAKVPSSTLPGGNGLSFDWTLLKTRNFDIPWFLSGGLNIQNVLQALKISGAKMVDVSSSLEGEPGKKDAELVKLFIERVKQYEFA